MKKTKIITKQNFIGHIIFIMLWLISSFIFCIEGGGTFLSNLLKIKEFWGKVLFIIFHYSLGFAAFYDLLPKED